MGSNPSHGKVFFFFLLFFLSPHCEHSLSLSLTMPVAPARILVIREAKREESQKNPSSAIYEANMDIRGMCGEKGGSQGFKSRNKHCIFSISEPPFDST